MRQEKEHTRRTGRTKKGTLGHRIYVGATIVSAIIVAAFLFWHLFSAPPDVPELPVLPQTTTDAHGNQVEVDQPDQHSGRKKEFYTFLLVGQDTFGGGNTDTMMLAAYDVPNQVLNVMSLPRDTYVNFNGRKVLLNSIFNRSGGGKDVDKGIRALKDKVGELTGVTPDYHVIVQWKAVGELVDAIDGVDFDVPRRMYYNDLSQDFRIDLQPGMQHLDGKKAMQLIRWRHNSDDHGNILNSGYANGDLGRIQTQQDFMKAIISKCLKPSVLLPNLTEYIRIFQDNVITDLTASNMAYFAKSAVGSLDMENVAFTTLPNKNAGDGAHLVPVSDKIPEVVNAGFNPYLEEITLADLEKVTPVDRRPRPQPTPEPVQTPEPSESPEPSGEPAETEEPLLPPDVSPSVRPEKPDKDPEQTTAPAETGKPTSTPGPAQTPEPTAVPEPTAAPEPTPAPAIPTPQPEEDEPLLPPGV